MKPFFLTALMAVFICSCVKHNLEDEIILPDAAITFLKPNEGDIFHKGDSVNVKAIVIGSDELHGYDLLIRKSGDSTTYFFTHIHEEKDTINIDQIWKDTLSAPTDLEAELTVYLDHELHTKKSKVSFRSQ